MIQRALVSQVKTPLIPPNGRLLCVAKFRSLVPELLSAAYQQLKHGLIQQAMGLYLVATDRNKKL